MLKNFIIMLALLAFIISCGKETSEDYYSYLELSISSDNFIISSNEADLTAMNNITINAISLEGTPPPQIDEPFDLDPLVDTFPLSLYLVAGNQSFMPGDDFLVQVLGYAPGKSFENSDPPLVCRQEMVRLEYGYAKVDILLNTALDNCVLE